MWLILWERESGGGGKGGGSKGGGRGGEGEGDGGLLEDWWV